MKRGTNPFRGFVDHMACALDPVRFVETQLAGYVDQLDPWQIGALRNRSKNLLILASRQCGKSTVAGMLALHTALYTSTADVLLLTPTMRQSVELFDKMSAMLKLVSRRPKITRRTSTRVEFANGSNPAAIRGFSNIALIIEDEAAFVLDAAFTATRPMLLNNPHGRHILASTPYGARGHFFQLWNDTRSKLWDRISIKAEDLARISEEALEEQRQAMSIRAFRQEFGCEFLASGAGVFDASRLERLVDGGMRSEELPDGAKEAAAFRFQTADPGAWANIR